MTSGAAAVASQLGAAIIARNGRKLLIVATAATTDDSHNHSSESSTKARSCFDVWDTTTTALDESTCARSLDGRLLEEVAVVG